MVCVETRVGVGGKCTCGESSTFELQYANGSGSEAEGSISALKQGFVEGIVGSRKPRSARVQLAEENKAGAILVVWINAFCNAAKL